MAQFKKSLKKWTIAGDNFGHMLHFFKIINE